MIYLAIAENLNLPMYGVNLPSHIFIRWNLNNNKYINWETTTKNIFKDKYYIRKFKVTKKEIKKKIYLHNLNKNEIKAITYNNLGAILTKENKFDKAIELYKKAIKLDPNISEAYFNIALIFYKNKNNKKAKEFYVKTIEKNEKDINANNILTNILFYEKKYDQALIYYKNSIKIKPQSITYYNIGQVYKIKKEYKKAIEYYKKAIKMNPKDKDTIENIIETKNIINKNLINTEFKKLR